MDSCRGVRRKRTCSRLQEPGDLSRQSIFVLCSVAVLISLAGKAEAWIYPEHRDIAVLAVQGLDPAHKGDFDRLWQDARAGSEERICAQGADTEQGVAPLCIDWAALSGIAGDHSCSSLEMLDTVIGSDWILSVADVAARLKLDLAAIPVTAAPAPADGRSSLVAAVRRRLEDRTNRVRRSSAVRTADTELQRVDPEYATRAESNDAHFVLPRPDTKLDPYEFLQSVLLPEADINALGVYTWYHLSALQKASRLANEQLTPEQKETLARSILFDEAFALHFLEDSYAAGHVAGSWGNVAERKGTHDYYNEHGLEVRSWTGGNSSFVLMGDAHMRPEDAALAAKAVQTSLEQVLDAATGHAQRYDLPYTPMAPASAYDFDVCRTAKMPKRPAYIRGGGRYRAALVEVIIPTPVPGLTPGLGAMPRFRSEVGPYVGLSGGTDLQFINGGFESSQSQNGLVGGVDISFRIGVGLEGALGDAGDGMVFAQVGYRGTWPSTNRFSQDVPQEYSGNLSAAIPGQWGIPVRIRMPFYLIPGDLLLLSPMYFLSRSTYTQMVVTAINGGLIPWQQVLDTQVGNFQFMLGREVGVTFYGLGGNGQLLAPSDPPGGSPRLVNFKSVGFDVPVLEYSPYRGFSTDQSSSLKFQLAVGADVPYASSTVAPSGAPPADLRTVWSLGLRMVFTWRHYW